MGVVSRGPDDSDVKQKKKCLNREMTDIFPCKSQRNKTTQNLRVSGRRRVNCSWGDTSQLQDHAVDILSSSDYHGNVVLGLTLIFLLSLTLDKEPRHTNYLTQQVLRSDG